MTDELPELPAEAWPDLSGHLAEFKADELKASSRMAGCALGALMFVTGSPRRWTDFVAWTQLNGLAHGQPALTPDQMLIWYRAAVVMHKEMLSQLVGMGMATELIEGIPPV